MSELIKVLNEYKKIALYGLSKETEKLLQLIDKNFWIIGLLDGYQEDGSLYGKKITSLSNAIAEGVQAIIVVARPASARIIVNRIGKTCIDNKIKLYDVQGNELSLTNEPKFDLQGVVGVTYNELILKAKEKDVISFDIFDTLVTRRTLFSTDIYEILEKKLIDKGIKIKDLSKKRLSFEQKLSQNGYPTLDEIYNCITEELSKELVELEWKTDSDYLIPRYDIVKIFNELKTVGKDIYLVSDTYYSKTILGKMLEKLNITGYKDIITSCEYNVSKKDGLFKVLKERIDNKSCLHIGDDVLSDVTAAQKYGFDVCHIYSKTELFEKTGYLGLNNDNLSLSDRIKLGIFASHMFNSPFQFENNGKIAINNGYDLGYLILAPLVTSLVIWLHNETKKDGISNIWFAARDGYLIKKMYDLLGDNIESHYFLTSRICAMRAALKDEKDINDIINKDFNGSYLDMIFNRFGVKSEDEILIKAEQNKRAYIQYIDSVSLKEDDIAFFDFVSTGTSQMYISRIADRRIKGYYFLRLYDEIAEKQNLDIKGFYNDFNVENPIDNYYFVLESVLTSYMPSIIELDFNGTPIYAKECRETEELEYIKTIHNGILDYFVQYIKLCPINLHIENKKLTCDILKLINKIQVDENMFMKLRLEDNFYNRITEMKELL